MSASNPLARILESNHLIRTNFKDQLKNFKIVLISEKIKFVLDQEPLVLPNRPSAKQKAAYDKQTDEDNRIKCYVLASMLNELQSQHEYMPTTKAMITHLQELYGKQSCIVCFKVSKILFNMKMHEGQSVHNHCIIMIKDVEELKKLRLNMQKELQMNLILQSLISSYNQFVINFYMNKFECTISELVNMLVPTEEILKSLKGTTLAVK